MATLFKIFWLGGLLLNAHQSHGVDVMSIVNRRLLGLTDGGGNQIPEKIQVIGAGFGRTGTESLCSALTVLGFNTYHGTKALRYGHLKLWNEWFETGSEAVFDALSTEGFNATTDFPTSVSFEALAKKYPEAKVVLSVHPGGSEGWSKSVHATLSPLELVFQRAPFRYLHMFREYLVTTRHVQRILGFKLDPVTQMATAESLQFAYDSWLKRVRQSIPPERLLVHCATDGYEPLASFLGKPVPMTPYPRVNDSEDLRRQINNLQAVANWWPFFLSAVGVCISAWAISRVLVTIRPNKQPKKFN